MPKRLTRREPLQHDRQPVGGCDETVVCFAGADGIDRDVRCCAVGGGAVMATTFLEVYEAMMQAESLRDTYLREGGWKHTCDTPGNYWLWEKKLPDGRTVLLDAEDAYAYQHRLAADEEDRLTAADPRSHGPDAE